MWNKQVYTHNDSVLLDRSEYEILQLALRTLKDSAYKHKQMTGDGDLLFKVTKLLLKFK